MFSWALEITHFYRVQLGDTSIHTPESGTPWFLAALLVF